MTIEELRDYVEEERSQNNIPYHVYSALIDGIDTLEQEPCEDAISRQAALDAFGLFEKTRKYGGDYSGYDTMLLYEIQQTLEDLPSVTPKQRTGHWIMSDDGLYRPICDNCGAHPWKGYIPTVEEATKVFEYCPKCGAKMESEETQHADR